VAPGGRLLIIDFAPHDLEHLRVHHQHRRLGFADEEISRWLALGGLQREATAALPPAQEGLTVKVWSAERPAHAASASIPARPGALARSAA
jgi:ArsR family transcriptional regulator